MRVRVVTQTGKIYFRSRLRVLRCKKIFLELGMDSSAVKVALLDMGGTINGILQPSDSVTMTSRVRNSRSKFAVAMP